MQPERNSVQGGERSRGSGAALSSLVLPAVGVFIMTWGWLIPVFLAHAFFVPVTLVTAAMCPYVVVLFANLLTGAFVFLVERRWGIWNRSQYWGKYFFLGIAYSVNVLVARSLILCFDARGFLAAIEPHAMRFKMLLEPSIAVYFLAGAGLALAVKVLSSRSGRPRAE